MTVSDLSEAELIARIQSRLQAPPEWLHVGIGDDAAVVQPVKGRLEVLTVDALVEGVHFDRAIMPADAIGHRALAANLSDLAAMGATPRFALLSLGLPAGLPCAEFDAMIGGMSALATHYQVHVIGGNITRSPGPLVIDITLAGIAKPRRSLTRGGAKPGDHVYVTGSIGGAAAGLGMLRERDPAATQPQCVQRYCYPSPRVRVGELLGRGRLATACMDLSDGLGEAVHQIARASNVGMEISADLLPIEPAARGWFMARGADPVPEALTAGDDYELLFTCSPRAKKRLLAGALGRQIAVAQIGTCVSGGGTFLKRGAGGGTVEAVPRGYQHF